jgi:hypothetical protein
MKKLIILSLLISNSFAWESDNYKYEKLRDADKWSEQMNRQGQEWDKASQETNIKKFRPMDDYKHAPNPKSWYLPD